MTELDTTAAEHVDVPIHAGGDHADYCLRYRGHHLPSQSIAPNDVIVVRKATTATPGQLVVTTGDTDTAHLAKYQPGMAIAGVMVGLMRKVEL